MIEKKRSELKYLEPFLKEDINGVGYGLLKLFDDTKSTTNVD